MAIRPLTLLVALFVTTTPFWAAAQSNRPDPVYYPGAAWQHKTPAESGFDPARLKEAIDFAIAGETRSPRDLVMNHYETFGREPFGYAIGPIKDRGDPTGLVIRLNTERGLWPSAPPTAFAHISNGTNMIYVDREHDLVAVVRWIDGRAIDGFLKRLLASAKTI